MTDSPEAARQVLDDLAATVNTLTDVDRMTLARGAWIPPWLRGRSPGTDAIWDALRALLDREIDVNGLYYVLIRVAPDSRVEMTRSTTVAIETDPDHAGYWRALDALIQAMSAAPRRRPDERVYPAIEPH